MVILTITIPDVYRPTCGFLRVVPCLKHHYFSMAVYTVLLHNDCLVSLICRPTFCLMLLSNTRLSFSILGCLFKRFLITILAYPMLIALILLELYYYCESAGILHFDSEVYNFACQVQEQVF